MRTWLHVAIVLCLAVSLEAQDIHFSQFNEHPSLLNPALTGATGSLRASASYKSQWRSIPNPYTTMGASFEMGRNFGGKKKKKSGKFGTARKRTPGRLAAGLSVYRDKAGDAYLGLTQLNLSLASFVPLGKRSFLSAGVQGSYGQRKLDNTQLVFPNQYSGLGYDPGMPSGEQIAADRLNYTDYAAGIAWTFGQDEKTFVTYKEIRAKLGASVYHIMEPGRQFVGQSFDALQRKYVGYGDLLMNLNSLTAIAPSFVYQLQGASSELVAGCMFRYYKSNSTKYTGYVNRTVFGLGAYYRTGDAGIISALFEWDERYAAGLSCDFTLSELGTVSRWGGFELTLRYSPAGGYLYQKQ